MTKPISTVLAVDDEPKALLLLRNLIEPEGCRVLLASSGAEALTIAAREHPDVVLLDIMMPEMDGYEVCRRLRADRMLAQIPILMLTALDDRESRLRGLETGADDFVSKPFDSVELRTRVRTIIRLNRFRRLYEQRARFEAAINHAPDAIVLAEFGGTILHQNPAFLDLFDSTTANRENIFTCFPSESGLEAHSRLRGKPGAPLPILETSLLGARQGVQHLEVTHGPIPWEGREILLFTIRDVTERKTLEQQLLRSQRIELLGQLASSAIHDVNNILAAISGSAQLLELKNGADLSLHLGHIVKSTERGASVLRQILMFARGEDGELEAANPSGVVAEVAHMVKETFGKSYPVEYQTAENLPDVLVDPTQIHQIVMNLCVNARDAMPRGGRLNIGIELRRIEGPVAAVMGDRPAPGDYVAVSVRDTGTGIPSAILPKLFDPFFTTKAKGQGTGLGLATVIRLVRRHKGFVILDTEVGKGTCFTCCFPAIIRSPA